MKKGIFKKLISVQIVKSGIVIILLLLVCLFIYPYNVYAVDTEPNEEEILAEEARKSLPIVTNSISEWPAGPINGAEAAILMEVDTNAILYAKNIDEKLFPASTTKMMTALLVVENCSLDETVTFSKEAIDNTEYGSSRIGLVAGEQLSVEDCLYGLLLGSANEVAYGLAEHVGGTLDDFVVMMNEKAAQLGCLNTNFVNASGLPDDNHYTSAYDMALIAKEFFSNEILCLISGTYKYTIPATNMTSEQRYMENHHKLVTGKKYEYEGIIGGKTGFTKAARQTLVSCAQRDGMKLICVVLKDESPNQFLDTIDLFDYGFAGFKKLSIAEYETRYNLNSSTFFHTNFDVMGSSKDILTLNKNGLVVIPKVLDFADAEVVIDYLDNDSEAIARLTYMIGGNVVGTTTIDYADNERQIFEFANIITDSKGEEPQSVSPAKNTVFVTISSVLKKVLIIGGILFVIIMIWALIVRYIKSVKRAKKKTRNRYKSRSENTLHSRYGYKKRSENRKQAKDSDARRELKNGETLYQRLSQSSANAVDTRYQDEFYEENTGYGGGRPRNPDANYNADIIDTTDYGTENMDTAGLDRTNHNAANFNTVNHNTENFITTDYDEDYDADTFNGETFDLMKFMDDDTL